MDPDNSVVTVGAGGGGGGVEVEEGIGRINGNVKNTIKRRGKKKKSHLA